MSPGTSNFRDLCCGLPVKQPQHRLKQNDAQKRLCSQNRVINPKQMCFCCPFWLRQWYGVTVSCLDSIRPGRTTKVGRVQHVRLLSLLASLLKSQRPSVGQELPKACPLRELTVLRCTATWKDIEASFAALGWRWVASWNET